jgi:hypothetical protein
MRSHDHPVRRSGAFWVFWLAAAAAGCAAVALSTGQHQADPRGTLAGVFGIIALYFVVFFVVRLREVAAGKTADLRGAERGAKLTIHDPTTLTDSELYGAMAIRPLDPTALKARAELWETERKGTSSGALIVILIFLSVPPIYFFHTFVPTIVGAVVIGTFGLVKSVQLMGAGMAGLYDLTDQVMAPLGLKVTERYTVSIEPSLARGGGPGPVTRGALSLSGQRHGRHVRLRTPATSGVRTPRTVEVSTRSDAIFELRSRDGRLHPDGDAPAAVRDLTAALPRSTRWSGIRAHSADGLIVVKRKSAAAQDALLDLWLAERLAGVLST